MKKITILFLIFTTFLTSVFAIDLSIGGNINFDNTFDLKKTRVGGKITETKNIIESFLGGDFFFDAYYIRTGIGVMSSFGMKYQEENTGTIAYNPRKAPVLINIRLYAFAKFPILLTKYIYVYPILGAEADFNIAVLQNKTNIRKTLTKTEKAALHHYYILGGIGADFFFNDNIFFTTSGNFGFDINARLTEKPEGKTHTAFKIGVDLGLGYKF